MDGFILTHAYERVDMPTQEQVDAFLPPYEPRQVLDPAEPVSIGAMVGPEAFMEVRYLAHAKQMQALELIPQLARRVPAASSAATRGGLMHAYRTEDAETDRRGARLGARHHQGHGRRDARARASRSACSASPASARCPTAAVRDALAARASASSCSRRASPWASAASSRNDVRTALSRLGRPPCYTVIAGLGGRADHARRRCTRVFARGGRATSSSR
ncbi:MAG: hypothetical protein MZW92_42705 [Comamonadaceae bacterium]|nr:hypothetical protein [Comamonadaceae bacterium]